MGVFKLFSKQKYKDPEEYYYVTITTEFVKVEHPKRKTEQIFWRDINEIRMINTSAGPFAPDVWLALYDNSINCLIPKGAKGFDEVYNIVSKYTDFDFQQVTKSMSSTNDEQFILWVRK